MKHLMLALAIGLAAAESEASVLLGDGTLYSQNDLTIIQSGVKVYEFLDLTSTYALPVWDAIALHQAQGFRWANLEEVTALMSALDWTFTVIPGDYGPFRYEGSLPWGVAVHALIDRLGRSPGGAISGASFISGFINYTPIPGRSTRLYANPVGSAYSANNAVVWESPTTATFLVRDVTPVPEPGTLALWIAGGAIGALRLRSRLAKSSTAA